MRRFLLTTAFAAISCGALAEDAALILGSDSYETLGRVTRGADVLSAQKGLEALGLNVTTLRNGREDTTGSALTVFSDNVEGAERIVVVLSGRFATDGDRTWFLTSEAADPDLLTVGRIGVSVESVLHVLADAPSKALLLIASEGEGTRYDRWLRSGVGALDIPQGVTVVMGDPRSVGAFATEALTQPQIDLMPKFADYGLTVTGYVPSRYTLMPMRPAVVPAPAPLPVDNSAADDALWQGAVALDTIEAYRNYIARFPAGRHADEAEQVISEIIAEPNRQSRLLEEALNLSRDDRREIQRDLSILDYNTRGIDGIFGSGSRNAITNWQQENGYAQTSYLTQDQITRLDAQAARRAAELEAEAERRRREQELLDRSYWEETGAKGDEPGLRAYLDRYPDGFFAEVATTRLAAIEEDKRAAAAAEDRAAWDKAREGNTVASYQDYLSGYPEGEFVAEAQAKITELTKEDEEEADREAARAEETALGLNDVTRRLIEARLDAMGMEPGPVDGTFNTATRRAIRRYQRTSELDVTGFLNEATVVRLLADTVLGK